MHTLDFKTLMICMYITQPAVLKYIAYTYAALNRCSVLNAEAWQRQRSPRLQGP